MFPQGIARGVVAQAVSPAELYQVISDATSQDPQRLRSSAERLKEMLQQPGVYDALHEIAATKSVPLPVRIQASIQFKNEALKNWRSRKVQSDENRARIRARCMTLLDEEDQIIAECNKVAVSRIARAEYPASWPSLISDLMTVIESGLQQHYSSSSEDPRSTLMLQRALELLCGVIKEFSSMKMLNGIKTMSLIVEQLYTVLFEYYSKISTSLPMVTNPPVNDSRRTFTDLVLAHSVYKSLTTMACWLWLRSDKMSNEEGEKARALLLPLFQNSTIQLKALVEWRYAFLSSGAELSQQAHSTIVVLTKHIRRFGKFFFRLGQLSRRRLAELPGCDALVIFYWEQIVQAINGPPERIADNVTALYPVRFLVQGLVLFKEVVGQWTSVRRDGTINKQTLSKEFIENAVKLIVTRLLPLNESDWQGWMNDPEEWVNEEDRENDQWEFELRPCSERVLVQISNKYPEFVSPLLKETFTRVSEKPAADVASVLQKEALYCAIGRCCQHLKSEICFEQWVDQTLVVEAQDKGQYAPILKRRIAWVLGKWLSESCASPNNATVWKILVHLLNERGPGSTVVRLTAAVALREAADTLDFDIEVLTPILPQAVTGLITLIGEADAFESKRRVDNTLNVVIERAGPRIIPFVNIIIGPLPSMWDDAGEDWLFKSALLVTLTNVVKAIGSQSSGLGNIVVPLIEESMNQGINLDGDGVNLWKEALRSAATLQNENTSSSLARLVPLAIQHLSSNLDLLGTLLNIVESYILLDGAGILQAYSLDLFKAFLSILQGSAIKENVKEALRALNLLVQVTAPLLWAENMHNSGLYAYLLKTLMDGEEDPQIICEIIYLISRIVMADRQIFLQLMSAAVPILNMAETHSTTEESVFERFLEQWWNKFDTMSEPQHRKLVAMGTAALVSTGRPEILSRLHSDFFNLWLDVFGEIKEARNDPVTSDDGEPLVSPLSLTRHWELHDAPTSFYQGSEGTPEYGRRKEVYDRDPVRTTQLSAFVGVSLQQAEANCGPDFQQRYLTQVDPTVLMQIQNELRNG